MDNLLIAVKEYLSINDGFAMQIDGEWGTGKTYHVQKNIIPKIKKENETDEENFDVIYISVFGFNELEVLKRRIRYELQTIVFPKVKNQKMIETTKDTFKETASTVAPAILASTFGALTEAGIAFIEGRIEKKLKEEIGKKKIVIFIDDLERISESINLVDLLGFIQTNLIEELKLKIIIVSNSKKLKTENMNAFKEYKEKIINKSYTFFLKNESIKRVITGYSENRFIQVNAKWVTSIFEQVYWLDSKNKYDLSTINLRTVFAAVSNYEMLIASVAAKEKIDSKHIGRFSKSLFLNTLVFTKEYREGHLTTDTLDDLLPLFNTMVITEKNTEGEKEIKESGKVLLLSELENKYSSIKHGLDRFSFDKKIGEFVLLSYLDQDAKIYQNWKRNYYPLKIVNDLDDLQNFYTFEEEKVEYLQKKVYGEAIEGKMDVSSLIRTLLILKEMEDGNLLWIDDDYEERLLEIIFSRVDDYASVLSFLQTLSERYGLVNNQYNEQRQNFMLNLKAYYVTSKQEEIVMTINNDIEGLKQAPNLETVPTGMRSSLFDVVKEKDFLKKVLFTKKNTGISFASYLEEQYRKNHIGYVELKQLIGIIRNMRYTHDSTLDKVSHYTIDKAMKMIIELITEFESSRTL